MASPVPADVAAVQDAWQQRGRFVALPEGHRVFVVQEGAGPDLMLVHGFPSCSHDFAAALPLLRPRFRVTLFDQLGFGFSDKPTTASYSLLDQGRRAGELARALGIARATLVGHDMGLTVAVEMLCRHDAGELGFAMDGLVRSSLLTTRSASLARSALSGATRAARPRSPSAPSRTGSQADSP
jgi:pimeloyl-ACP methyl ester carboxylesterase